MYNPIESLTKAGIDQIEGSGEVLEDNLRDAPTSINLPTGDYSLTDADKMMGAGGALSLLQGMLMGEYEGNMPDVQGLNVGAPPPSFNMEAAQADVANAEAYGQQRGGNIGKGIGTGIGLLLAPLTGGLSIGLGGALGQAAGGFIGGNTAGNKAQEVYEDRLAAAQRNTREYRRLTGERDIEDERRNMRMEDLMRQAAFGDLNNLYG